MSLLSTAQDPAVPPTPPAGSSTQQITYQYDQLGRLTLTTYPPTQITTLTNTDTNNPTPVVVTESVTERNVYDAYGNLVQSYDRNGNLTTNFYDAKGRKTATVDPLGYLTQWVYDDQGNEIHQFVYTQPLNPATVAPGTPPTPPSGEVYQTDVQYDAASRKVAEIAPQISTFDPSTQTSSPIRSTTTYTYDKVGNQLTRTIGFGTAQQVTEYSYYDAVNRRIAFIDNNRVLSTYGYDANGNLTVQKRYFNAVPGSIDLTQLSGSTDFASLVAADASNDQETDNTYDAANRYTQTSDILSSGTLSKEYDYDAAGNRTYA
jgi:YD repeat-containing protein